MWLGRQQFMTCVSRIQKSNAKARMALTSVHVRYTLSSSCVFTQPHSGGEPPECLVKSTNPIPNPQPKATFKCHTLGSRIQYKGWGREATSITSTAGRGMRLHRSAGGRRSLLLSTSLLPQPIPSVPVCCFHPWFLTWMQPWLSSPD